MPVTLLTPDAKEALRKTIRGLRPRLLDQLLKAAKGEYGLDPAVLTGGWKSPAYDQAFIHYAGPLATVLSFRSSTKRNHWRSNCEHVPRRPLPRRTRGALLRCAIGSRRCSSSASPRCARQRGSSSGIIPRLHAKSAVPTCGVSAPRPGAPRQMPATVPKRRRLRRTRVDG